MVETASRSGNRTPASSRHPHQYDWNVMSPASPFSLKSVLLHDWWLVKNKSRQISVAGLVSEERLGVRSFSSAPISRRINTTTLESIDGIIITISGFINRSQMHQNGFPFWVCNDFELGFPYDWKECITQCNNEESAKRCVSTEKSSNSSFSLGTKANSSLPLLFDNLPAARIRDLVLNMTECSDNDDDDATILEAKDMKTEVLTDSSAQLSAPTADKNISPQVVSSLNDISSVRRSGRLKVQIQKS